MAWHLIPISTSSSSSSSIPAGTVKHLALLYFTSPVYSLSTHALYTSTPSSATRQSQLAPKPHRSYGPLHSFSSLSPADASLPSVKWPVCLLTTREQTTTAAIEQCPALVDAAIAHLHSSRHGFSSIPSRHGCYLDASQWLQRGRPPLGHLSSLNKSPWHIPSCSSARHRQPFPSE